MANGEPIRKIVAAGMVPRWRDALRHNHWRQCAKVGR